MGVFGTVLQVFQLIAAIGVVILVLLQHGKGADMGAAFGSGASGSLFGASGSANFLSRMTAGFATAFFVTTLALGMVHGQGGKNVSGGVMSNLPADSAVPGATPVTAPVATPGVPTTPSDIPK
jgi:preprotein translocase subunit SecG